MNKIQHYAFLFAIFFLYGCAASRPAGQVEANAPEVVETREAEPAPASEPGMAPENWMHLDGRQSTFYGVGAERAYGTLLNGRTPLKKVVVAVLDSGIDVEHEDLRDVIWSNTDEQAGNGVDDDGNGYVDDVHGWNFIGGKDGENIDNDTFEVTREYVRLSSVYEGADPASIPSDQEREYTYFLEVRDAYEAEVQEMLELNANIATVLELLDAAHSIMSDLLGTPYTIDQVKELESENEMVQQAQAVMVYFDQLGLDKPTVLEEQGKIEDYLQKGLNTDFDPRSIVGDNYADVSETAYGNRDVEGPDAFHGTHVAGIIGARRGNGIGMDGIADHVEIMVVRVVPDGDERDKDVANGIRYAVDNGADVINMSFGKNFSPYKPAVDEAVRYASSKDVLLVHAAGNDGVNNDSTSHFPLPPVSGGRIENENWIEVGASSWEGAPNLAASFSNYGREGVDVFAPGVSMYSTVPGSAYDRADGTSMAAPVVSGIAALIMAYYPEFSAREVKDIIMQSAVSYAEESVVVPGTEDRMMPFGALSRTGAIVNAYEALKLAEERSQ